jgi:Fe-Mn family superoxide dismutase
MAYTERKFDIPELKGISRASIDQHISLYQGYVKNFNAISASLPEYAKDAEKNNHALAELIRRRSFEWDGMRLHELYFPQFEGGATPLSPSSALGKQIEKEYKKLEHFIPYFNMIANIRGPGWAILYWDPIQKELLTGFSEQQHQGHFVSLPIILALDVWEHAYLLDYGATGRTKYINAFFENLNWKVSEERFDALAR